MKHSPLVSILMTTYNCEGIIEKSVESIVQQTYDNIELVVVDDGSTDSTPLLLKKMSENDNRIKLYPQPRIGRSKSLNFGLSKCLGEYVAINDADDFSKPERILKQLQFLEKHHEVGLLGTSKEIQEEDGSIYSDTVPTDDKSIKYYFTKGQPIQHSSVMVRKTLLDKIGGYNEGIPFLLDRDIFIRIGRISKLHQLSEPLIILNRTKNQYFRNKYNGFERAKLSTYYQLKAVDAFNFSQVHKIPIIAKFIWSFILEIKNKITTKN